MTVEPDGQQPIDDDDDDSVLPEDQTANLDSSFDRSLPPADKTSKKAGDETKKETNRETKETHKVPGKETSKETNKARKTDSNNKDPSSNPTGAEQRSRSTSSGKSGLGSEPSMSILQTERSIAEKPDTTPEGGDSTGAESKPDTADDSFSDRSSPIGRYAVRRLLGQGAFGRVYEAHDPQLDRLVAVKVSKDIRGAGAVDRFLREARSAAHLRHPAIIPVFEYGQVDDLSMIVYEIVDGETLRSYVKRNAPLELSETISIIRKIAEGLDYAHREGIIHRDIKPDNVLIDKKGEPHIADFGCARRFDDQDMHQTIEGSILGTPMYMSPEQASGHSHHADGRTDVWSLGVMLYEMVSGKKPFEGKLSDLLHLIRHHDAKPLRKIHSSTPRDIETICSKCLRRELDHRFATAGDLADELERFERGEPIVSRRISVLTRTWLWAKRNRAVASLLTTVAIILVTATIISTFFMMQARSANKERAKTSRERLITANSSLLGDVLNDLEWDKDSMLDNIREKLADQKLDEQDRRRLTIAQLHLEKDERKKGTAPFDTVAILDLLLSADGYELVTFCNTFSDGEKDILSKDLWKLLGIGTDGEAFESEDESLDEGQRNARRFRANCALAQFDPDSPNWEENIVVDVAGFLSAMIPNDVQREGWLPTVAPIRDNIEPTLQEIFNERRTSEDASPETAAFILSELFKDKPDYIVETLVPTADAHQLAQLMKALKASENRETSLSLMSERLKNFDLAQDSIDVVNEKANLIVALIQLEYPDDKVWQEKLQHANKSDNTVDNSVGTEVIERLGPARTPVQLLLTRIKNEWTAFGSDSAHDPDVLAVELQALGQFNRSQIPQTRREQVNLELLESVFKDHSDARVHCSARWLMTKWGFDSEVQDLENELKREMPKPGFEWHVDLFGNTFVVFDVDNFVMDGSDVNWPDWPAEGKHHRFGICIHEVTSEQFVRSPIDTQHGRQKTTETDIPVNEVNFFQALAYCRWLTDDGSQLEPAVTLDVSEMSERKADNIPTGKFLDLNKHGYRLPTVAERKHACDVGTITKRSFGINDERLRQYAWYSLNSGNDRNPVARLKPNEAGLFDMLGNVSEWCLDWYLVDGELQERYREARGGSYQKNLKYVDRTTRRSAPSKNIADDLGFRLARTYPPVDEPNKNPPVETEQP